MATREDRMRQRLRGAVRHQVEDISFGFQLPESDDTSQVEVAPDNAASSTHATPRAIPRTTPGASEKPRLTPTRQPSGASSRGRSSARRAEQNPDPHGLTSGEADEEAPQVSEGDDDVLALLPPAPSGRSFTTRRSLATSDVVEESPIHAPGSGHRRSIGDEDIRSSSRRLQSVLWSIGSEAHANMSSSPLTRKSTQRARNQPRPSPHRSSHHSRSSNPSLIDDIDELSPQASRIFIGEGEIAEEVGDTEAARVLLRKRPRNSVGRKSSPLLDSIVEDHDSGPDSGQDSPTEAVVANSKALVEAQPPLKRRKRPQLSPAKQKQPIHKNKPTRKRTKRKPEPSQNDETSADEIGAIDDAAIVPVTVQRFARPRKLARGEDAEIDILAMDIPFVNQKGVNVIDVLAQSCEEVIGTCIEQLGDAVQREDSASTRKDLRVKLRALEAFAEELRTKFLTQTIMLDNLYSLRQRVKDAEATRNKLRDSILERRKEQEEIHIRMDAERETHESNRKLLANRLDMSSDFHTVRMCVEKGRREPVTLNSQQLQKAALTSLELSLPRIADQVCRTGDGGGLMRKVSQFNNFLERAATELESRV